VGSHGEGYHGGGCWEQLGSVLCSFGSLFVRAVCEKEEGRRKEKERIKEKEGKEKRKKEKNMENFRGEK
jgi:hypothetical protein